MSCAEMNRVPNFFPTIAVLQNSTANDKKDNTKLCTAAQLEGLDLYLLDDEVETCRRRKHDDRMTGPAN